MASVKTRLTVGGNRAYPPTKIIANTGTSDAPASIITDLRSDCAAQKESTAALTAIMNTILTQTSPGGGAGTGEGVEERTPTRNANLIPRHKNAGCAEKWSGTRTMTAGQTKIMWQPALVGGRPACRISRG